MRELSLDEIHVKTLDVMDYIHKVCSEHGIQYYLFYGTLIGAVRHHGFIPWDDDFDICMKRDDYIRFCQIVERDIHPYYKLCNRANTKNYYYGIARFVDTRYKYVSELEQLKQSEMGIFIDIYPLDNYGNTLEDACAVKTECLKFNREYMIYMNKRSVQGGVRTILRIPLHYYYHIRYKKDYNLKIDNIIYKRILSMTNEDDRQIGVVCWENSVHPFDKQWFDKGVLCDFEDRNYWIPVGYDNILREVYGDYMILPPESDRIRTHYYKIYEI